MTVLGVIGSGSIGTTVARLAVDAGIDVVMSNSRGPETLAETVSALGGRARAATAEEAAKAGDVVLVSVPLSAYTALPVSALAGNVVIETVNYYAVRDGNIDVLDTGRLTTSELLQQQLHGARTVKAFNNIDAGHIKSLARSAGAEDRSALPIAGDDESAKADAAALIGRLGFDTVDVGPLSESWRFEPETAAYTVGYCADPEAIVDYWRRLAEALKGGSPALPPAPDSGKPLNVANLRELLAAAERKLTADRIIA